MNLVDILVERTPVHRAMHPVMPGVLHHKEDGNLEADGGEAWEWHTSIHAAVLCHRMEQPDLWQFDREMTDEDEFGAGPLLAGSWDFAGLEPVFVEIGDVANDDPGETAAEVNSLVHHEAHDSSREDIILHVGVPALQMWLAYIALKSSNWRSARCSLVVSKRTAQSLSKMFK